MIFESAILKEIILPFLLVFVLLFAILQRSKILGEGKTQIDALISLVIALILIAFRQPREIIVNIMPWLAVGAVVMLVFMILYGFSAGDLSKGAKWMRIVFGILAGIFVLGLVLSFTGLGSIVQGWFSNTSNAELWSTIIFIAVIGGALVIALTSGSKSSSS